MRSLTIITCLCLMVMVSCTRQESYLTMNKQQIGLSSGQLIPAKSLASIGWMNYVYNKSTRTLSYTIYWRDLTSVPVKIAIHGPAARGFFTVSSLQEFSSGFTAAKQGSYSNTLIIDNVKIKEVDLLKGEFYVMINTSSNPTGEMRGQIEF